MKVKTIEVTAKNLKDVYGRARKFFFNKDRFFGMASV